MRLSVVAIFAGLFSDAGEPVPDGMARAPHHELSNLRPLIAIAFLILEDQPIF